MKKLIAPLIVLAVLAAAMFFFLKRRGDDKTLDLQRGRGSELAPANAVFYAEASDIPRSLERWKGTALYAIYQEPEFKEFTSRWAEFIKDNDVTSRVFSFFGDVEKADPAGMWVAMTALDPEPKLIAGFPYRGKKSDVESVVVKLKGELTKMVPGVKSDITTYDGTQIETLKDTTFTAVIAFRDNWFFLGNDIQLLQETLARYAAKPDAKPGLNTNANYQQTLKEASSEPDFAMWVDGAVVPEQGRKELPALSNVKAVFYTLKIDGPVFRERGYIHTGSSPGPATPIANRSIALTQPATYAYAVGDTALLEKATNALGESIGLGGSNTTIASTLGAKGLKFSDIFTTFGPELALTSAWERGWIFPDVLTSIEVRDKTKARLFAELIAESVGEGKLVPKEKGGTTLWTHPVGGPVQPTLAVNDRHMMIGLNDGTVNTALNQIATAGPNAATKPEANFPGVLKGVASPSVGLLYIDMRLLVEKAWDRVKPFIAMELLDQPDAKKSFDPAKLPTAATISKHLHPLIITMSTTEQGWLMESTGPFGATFALGTVGLGGAFWLKPIGGSFTPPVPPTPVPQTGAPGDLQPR